MHSKTPIKVIVILGPTSSGKSEAALQLAKAYSGEIISADSRQVYKDMDLGTGKVEGEWIENQYVSDGVVHHLIDMVDPHDDYNVAHFRKDCFKLIRQIHERGHVPIICGGTGFWISAVVDNVSLPEVKPNSALREELAHKSVEGLYDMLKELDPERAQNIDKKNKVRLIRAIEIAKTIGKVPQLKKEPAHTPAVSKLIDYFKSKSKELPIVKQQIPLSLLFPSKKKLPALISTSTYPVHFLQIGIDHPKEVLDERMKLRLAQRFEAGMVDEITMLKEKYDLPWERIQSFGLGYYWVPLFLQGHITEQEMKERVFLAERNYAKRQRTWFKRDKRIVWEREIQNIKILTQRFLKKNS